jgi:hypothetical protein
MRKQDKKYLILTVFVLSSIVFLLFFFNIEQSVIQFRTHDNVAILPLQTGAFTFAGLQGTYETPYLGSIACTGAAGGYYCYNRDGGNALNGDSFSNSLIDGQTLILSSSVSSQNDLFSNYIKTKVTLPKGNLTINYNYDIYSYYACPGTQIIFKAGDSERSFGVICASSKGHSRIGSDTFTIVLDKEQEVEFSVTSMMVNNPKQSSSGTMSVTFVKEIIPITNNNDDNNLPSQGNQTLSETSTTAKNKLASIIVNPITIIVFFAVILLLIILIIRKRR